ncbi:MAG: hypothetical protein ACERKK_07115 [Poseidonibacter sp.]|uniref:hypothetical protein n=1 Tax=Poseidonibacter sp. TaxID=2321188 RepID=UPI00359F0321
MESLIPSSGNIFIGAIIIVFILIYIIYQSKFKNLKRFTTILLIGFFSWSIGKDNDTSIILFFVVSAFVSYIWNKMDKEKEFEKNQELLNYNLHINTFGKYLELNPLGIQEIRHSSKLPFEKEKFIENSIINIRKLEQESQTLLLNAIPLLAYFRDDIPESGYISNISKLINSENDISNINTNSSSTIENLSNKLNEENDFPIDIYNKCNKESEYILKLLQTSISIK